ncbi:hypothetical protein NF700_12630 [Sphingomonadaceae bacterium OTU29MARTA1]|nr:hypothetical protein NF700_12630 [Sphingomonadaceae bacterium OTU29MARTA1]
MTYLSHTASFHSNERIAPSNRGIKHLDTASPLSHALLMQACFQLISVAIAGGLAVAPAQACSLPSNYQIPTTLELVERADTVVIAQVMDGGRSSAPKFRAVKLVSIASLKGQMPTRGIAIADGFLSNEQFRSTPSDQRNIVDANPDAFDGGCRRFVFDEGTLLVVFLRRRNGRYSVDAPALSRALEDISDPQALWVKAVRMYIEISALPKSRQRKEMSRRRSILAGEIKDADAQMLALDLGRALRSVP